MKASLSRLIISTVAILGGTVGVFASMQFFDPGQYARYIPNHYANIRQVSPTVSGISRNDALFLSCFRRPVVPTIGNGKVPDKEQIREELLNDYIRDGILLDGRASFRSDRERFIHYLMLRVNGSVPNYVSNKPVPTLPELLTSPDGNCGLQSFRLLIILELFGIFSRDINWLTLSLEGHHFVDAYDPIDNRSYLLDPTNNLVAGADAPWKGAGFIDLLATKSADERKQILDFNLTQYPAIFDSSDVKEASFYQWSESTRLRARDSIILALSKELSEMLKSWRNGKDERPLYTLCRFAKEGALGLASFKPIHCLSSDFLLNQSIFRE